jgi:asparagine N-glycosylation enzyme membrane subunit Stt3
MSRKKRRRREQSLTQSVDPSLEDCSDVIALSSEDIIQAEDAPSSPDVSSERSESSDVRLPGFFSGTLELPKDRAPWPVVILLILLAYALSVYVRLSWVEMAMEDERDSMRWEGYPTPNTHDSFYFAAILQKAHLGMHQENEMVPSVLQNGMLTTVSYFLLQTFPSLTIEQLLLWFTVYASGLVCAPIVLIGRLYGSALWGFFAACIAGIAHSYFNRTLAGYYDTDVFSVTAAVVALMFLLAALRRRSMGFALAGALGCFLYPFFYNRTSIPIALGIAFIGFQFLQALKASTERDDKGIDRLINQGGLVLTCIYFAWSLGVAGVFGGKIEELLGFTLLSIAVAVPAVFKILAKAAGHRAALTRESDATIAFAWRSSILVGIGIAASAFSGGTEIERSMTPFFLTLLALIVAYLIFLRVSIGERVLAGAGLSALFLWIIVADPIQIVFDPAARSTEAKQVLGTSTQVTQVKPNLNFRNTFSTVREGGSIKWDYVLDRITATLRITPDSGSPLHVPIAILALLGYGLLVLRHWEFLIAVPFVGIGLYAHWGGLRYTVHATAVAALGGTYLAMSLSWALARLARVPWNKAIAWCLGLAFTSLFVWPNIEHANTYSKRIDVVFPKGVINSLKTLEQSIATTSATKDTPSPFLVTWWDYGSGSWVYSGCRTFTSPAHHAERGADNFLVSQILRTSSATQAANLSRLMTEEAVQIPTKNKQNKTSYRTTVRSLFNDGTSDLLFYPKLFEEAKSTEFSLPSKTRETYLFLHYETLRIFQTIAGFSQRNLFAPVRNPKPFGISGIPFFSPYGMLLENPVRKEDGSVFFDDGSFLDAQGNFHLKRGNSEPRIVPIGRFTSAGDRRSSMKSLMIADNEHLVATAPGSRLIMVHAKNPHRIFLMDNRMRDSLLVRKYLLDQYDEEIVRHPAFEQLFNGKRVGDDYFLSTHGSRFRGKHLDLIQHSKQGYLSMSIDPETRLASLYSGAPLDGDGSLSNPLRSQKARQVPFNLHKVGYRFEGGEPHIATIQSDAPELFKYTKANLQQISPKQNKPNARHHAVQFVYVGRDAKKGFGFANMWLFIHDDLFRSTVIQGFIFENLDPELFEPIDLSPWAKIYRVNR